MRNYHKRPKPQSGTVSQIISRQVLDGLARGEKKNGHNLHLRPVVRSKLKIFPDYFLMHTHPSCVPQKP